MPEASISKQQPMRPALSEVLDSTNVTELEIDRLVLKTGNLETAFDTLSDTIGEGFTPELTIAQSLSTTNQQVATLAQFTSRFKFGKTEPVEIAAGASSSGSTTFATPFADTADVCVFLCCVGDLPILDEVGCTLISIANSGFTYSIINNDAENAHTVSLGYVAVQVN